ncbi:DHS-like NAD/FAD-binding domain-containing protein [Fomitopsis serialis]|uniref:DHS-like NAD/FAD-binding domain-containing protein n=1 Tax=Fomitopsis serialis TaxID=139415 RepID=UPI00200728A1|nr:DHS-like NAD/FAD-binding domain-containing protein [Neoantrodia serialis]KAH9928339.1 DHS-like NAD/FAD-binding domain-containing protein [Neoantrodia serialis]
MTVFLPLEASSPVPQAPAFLVPTPQPAAHLGKVIKAIMKARRIAVVCGAGISVQAGIPDFRSSDGLFQTLKKDNPTLSSGRDLFDASVFNAEGTTSMFCQMIAQLAELSEVALPTAFHHLLRALDERRRLLRVYTQNIDALEQKCGLTFGVPESDAKRNKPRLCKPKTDAASEAGPSSVVERAQNRLPTPPMETPRCIPLHGTLQQMHCQICTHSFPLREHLPALTEGRPPYCPECAALEETRQLVGKRSRGVGKLRPSVVLYNEMHKDGEEVGDVVRRDLIGSSKGKGRAGADLLLVVGTSLRVPGTKRIVREFSKAVHARDTPANESTSTVGLATPTPSPRRSPADEEEQPIRAVYLNLDFPVPTREWEGVFDVWIRGDAQELARLVLEEMDREVRAKEEAAERKRRREETALAAKLEVHMNVSPDSRTGGGSGKKRKAPSSAGEGSAKKQKVTPPTPVSMKKPAGKAKKPKSVGGGVLPVPMEEKRQSSKPTSGLKIRIPPRPIVLITTPVPKPKKPALATPTPSPPSSPLTPIPSSVHRHRSTLSPLSPILSPTPKPRLTHAYDDYWDERGDLTELSDNDSSGDECAESYLPSFHRSRRGPGG